MLLPELRKAWEEHSRGEYRDPDTGGRKVFDGKFLPLFETSSSPNEEVGHPRDEIPGKT
jgi:hypothetical protein